jgi:glucosamine-6-phosphate deaminase
MDRVGACLRRLRELVDVKQRKIGLKRCCKLKIKILADKESLGRAAADHAARSLRRVIHDQGNARIIAATGASQFEFLDALTSAPDIDWSRIEVFHLDEYVGLPATHPASFRKYLFERLIHKTGITRYHLLDGDGDPHNSIRETGRKLQSKPVDIAFAGIGENAHLAFNDPPANFETEEPYLLVELDDACRQQQVNEGWFAELKDVPRRAISMSVREVMRAKEIIVIVPDTRKAQAVKQCLEGGVTPMVPASILRNHPNATIYLDNDSAALLSPGVPTTA